MASKELVLTFLGTGAMKSTLRRGTSSLNLCIPTFRGFENWLVDCGEGTFRQLASFNQMATRKVIGPSNSNFMNSFKLGCSKLDRIFITHLHGDHVLGLCSVLLGISFDKSELELKNHPISVYGPAGIAELISSIFRICCCHVDCQLIINELCQVGQNPTFLSTSDPNYKKIHINAIYPNASGFWECLDEVYGKVTAGSVQHNIPTYGFIYQEKDQPGNIHPEVVMPILKRNEDALKTAGMSIFSVLKRFKEGERFVLPDASVLDPSDRNMMTEKKKGRKVSVLGDTRNAYKLTSLVYGSDVLVHEATVGPTIADAMIRDGMSEMKLTNGVLDENQITKITKRVYAKGHSTALVAAAFAKHCSVKNLILNHISNRYDSFDDAQYDQAIQTIRTISRKAFESENVFIPNDFESFILDGAKRE